LLKVGGLKISFGDSVVVNSISFSVGRGEILGIVGESGSGKSMSALSLMRLCPPSAKTIAEHGVWYYPEGSGSFDLLKLRDKEVRKLRGNMVSMIFQEPMTSLNAVQKCGPQVAEVLKIHKKARGKALKQRVLELFAEVKLPEPEQVWSKISPSAIGRTEAKGDDCYGLGLQSFIAYC
jgi:peptide/nickel transport system ATP-binding protein